MLKEVVFIRDIMNPLTGELFFCEGDKVHIDDEGSIIPEDMPQAYVEYCAEHGELVARCDYEYVYTSKNVSEYIDSMSKMSRPRQVMMLTHMQRDIDNCKAQNEIAELFRNARGAHFATILSEDIAIVQEVMGSTTRGYIPVVDNRPIYELFESFDRALIAALCYKYGGGGNYRACKYIFRMLGMEDRDEA